MPRGKRQKKRSFKINRLFSKCVVLYCVAYMTRVTERTLDIAEVSGINVSSILSAAALVFGGELLFLAFKDVISSAAGAAVDKVKATLQGQSASGINESQVSSTDFSIDETLRDC